RRVHRGGRGLEVPVHRRLLGDAGGGRGAAGGPAVGVVAPGVTTFDEATAITPTGAGCYLVRPDERFAVGARDGSPGPVNGGLLLASVLRAVLDTSPHPYPVATSAHFLRVAGPTPAQVRVAWLKQGKTAACARATVIQDGTCVLETTVCTGVLDEP